MRIYYHPTTRKMRIDHNALEAFLREQGAPDQRVKQLVIRVQPRVPKRYACSQNALGASRRNSIVICTWKSPLCIGTLNTILLHEVYHFLTKEQYGPDNYAIEYAKRPSEIAARAFAEQHKQRLFLAIDAPVLSEPVAAQAATVSEEVPAPAVCSSSSPRTPVGAILIAIACIGLGMVLLKPIGNRCS